MSALLKLRDYQTEAISELHRRWDAGDTRVPMVLATGLGKTVIFAHLIADWVRANVAKRVLVLVHTDELVQQAYKKIKDVAPHLHVGIVKAAQNDVTARVIVASVQSLRAEKRRNQIRNVGLIIVDECHHATAQTYRTILSHYGSTDCEACGSSDGHLSVCTRSEEYQKLSDVKVAGFTATLARGDRQKLSDIWQECTFQRGIAFGIRRGYLLDVRGKRIVVPDLDLSTVKKSGGDYQDGALGAALDASFAPSVIADAYAEHAGTRKGLAFWPLVETAQHGAEAFNAAGIPSAVVHGGTPREERRLILKKLHAGDIQVVHNCGVLTEGFDEPTVSAIVNAAPTMSAPRYQQRIGRGLRPDLSLPPDERGYCLILDAVPGAGSRRHNLRTLIDLSERAPEDLEMEDDSSLLELEDALDALEEGEEGSSQPEEYYGQVAAEDFDPLARTGLGAWLQTEQGTYFLPIGKEAYVLLVPSEEPGLYDVAWLTQSANGYLHSSCPGRAPYVSAFRSCSCGAGHEGGQGDLTEHTALHLDMAVSWAEEVLEDLGGDAALHEAGARERWRRAEMSYAWRKLCVKHGIEVRPGMRRGDAHDLVSRKLGTARIDPVVGFMVAARDGLEG